jgi:hypothetical protein
VRDHGKSEEALDLLDRATSLGVRAYGRSVRERAAR